ncbi:DUF4190 domain-containing protein [Streptomyces sp. NPDC091272]|uniref:DUF4190 domain-containing protein n=1 Tax=Streptomyces sp. NPDC091272 TaxID=3365981 RepID=UPI00380829CB
MSYPNSAQSSSDYGQTHPGAGVKQGNGMAIAALVLGILAILSFWTVIGGILLGVVAVVLGIIGARKARGGQAPHRTMAIIGAVLGGLGLVASVVIIAVGASILNSDEFKGFNDCVQHAKTQSERDACAKDYNKDMNN